MLTKNSMVKTPHDVGVVQGKFIIRQHGDAVIGYIVRMAINAQTKPHLNAENCLTPKATASGLWVFAEEQISLLVK